MNMMDMETSTSFHDFLNRMRHPSSLDLVRSIKSFIVSFSFYQPKPENDGKKVQDFFLSMEAAIRDHPLWTTSSEEDIDCALELAEKELLKMNAFKAPHEKVMCIMNCCRVINNLLLNAATSEHVPTGADEFLPVLIYVTIKANPPKLHSNLKFIKLYRRQAKLISEAEYYFTNLVSAKSFIVDLNAKSLSMDEIKFEENMQAAKLTNKVTSESSSTCQLNQQEKNECSCSMKMHNKLDDPRVFQVLNNRSNYPYMEAKSKELTVGDVDTLLNHYKDLVAKHTILCKAISFLSTSEREPLLRHLEKQGAGTLILQHHGINTDTCDPHPQQDN
ncbi:vacuolar protein sorting-associated protein 9A isoform X2 [Cajanus cajan]|uniref:vacuolar protein sorting-associated protein 9A isoform X2 n=1 Tax=Cajanus cajan TaxID=3821 RepID=UPI0010FB5A04|nr:vacuolar protein sorting-associated protein 9A isoform X2 [Cajanus cajan]